MSQGSDFDARRQILRGALLGAGVAAGALLSRPGPAAADDQPAAPSPEPEAPKPEITAICDQELGGDLEYRTGRMLISNCVIEGGTNGIFIDGDAEVTLSNCDIRNAAKSGVEVTSNGRVQILNSHIHHCGENGVRVLSPDPTKQSLESNVLIQGNYIHDIAAPWGDGATGNCIMIWSANNVQIVGNRCEKMIYSAIRVSSSANSSLIGNHCVGSERDAQIFLEFGWYGSIVAHNYFAGGGSGLSATNFLIGDGGVNYQGRQAVVVGNRFSKFTMVAAALEGDVIFTNNIIEDCAQWGVWGGFGDSCRNVAITNNLIMKCKWGVGVTTSKVSPVIVSGNRFFAVETPLASLAASWPLITAGAAAHAVPADTVHVLKPNYSEAGTI